MIIGLKIKKDDGTFSELIPFKVDSEHIFVDGNNHTLPEKLSELEKAIPTTTSQLTNDSNFVTNMTEALTNYYLKKDVYTKDEVMKLIQTAASAVYKIVEQLPDSSLASTTTLYLLHTGEHAYDMYIYTEKNGFEQIGTTEINLDDYTLKTEFQKHIEDNEKHINADERNLWNSKTNTKVKGQNELTYRTGEVNITPADIGLDKVENSADADKKVLSATKLENARKIGLSGVTATPQPFNGTDDITIPITDIPASLISGLTMPSSIEKATDADEALAKSRENPNILYYW